MVSIVGMFTRRHVMAGAGLVVAGASLGRTPRGQAGDRPADGFRVLTAQPGAAVLGGSGTAATPIWGYDGGAPGPVLQAKRGEDIKVRLVNELPEPTAVHWHGVRIANAMDGVPGLTQPPIAPGTSFDYRFAVPDAGTFWYHPPLSSAGQVGRGLAGVLIVAEAQPVDVDRDDALLFQDWQLEDAPGDRTKAGPLLTTNGAPQPDIALRANERLRLRLVNATYARVLSLRIDRHRAVVMAVDGEPAEPFAARDGRVALGPGNRLDLFIDATLAAGDSAPLMVETNGGEVAFARLVYTAVPPARVQPRADPRPLPDNPLPERIDLARALKLDVVLGGSRPENLDANTPLFSVRRGRAVMLALINRAEIGHVAHIHGHHFRLLDRLDDGWKPFWLDTLLVPAAQTTRIAFVGDNPGKWRLHAHALNRGQASFAGWFEIT